MTDADLLREARAGNAEAWRALYGRHLPAAWRQAWALTRDRHAAEDITAEAMLALLRNLDRLEGDAAGLANWLRSVVRCKAADHHRRAYRAGRREASDGDADPRESPNGAPAAAMEAEETRRQVQQILEQLPERQRNVLEWKYLDGQRVQEMAARLGETERAVEAVLHRARREFRRLYDLAEVRSAMGQTALHTDTDIQRIPRP